jgi:Secretion system C-terminal sorting domain
MRHFFYFLTLFIGINSWAQFGSISSQFCIGSTYTDFPIKEALLDNGNRILLLASNSPIAGNKTENCRGNYDFWVLCLDPNDQIVWQRTIGGSENDSPSNLIITEDQSIYLSGITLSPQSFEQTNVPFGSWDAWLIKMNSNGDILWDKVYGGFALDSFTQLIELPSGNILAFGTSASGMTGNKTSSNFGADDLWCLKLDQNGSILMDKSIGGSEFDYRPIVIQTASNRIKLVAESWSDVSGLKTEPSFGYSDIWVLDLDTNCNIIQQKTIGGSDMDKPDDLMWSSDGMLLILAESWSNQSGLKSEDSYGLMDTWILKLDADLNIIQQKTVGSNFEEYGGQFIEFANGNICVAVNSNSNPNQFMSTSSLGSFDIWIYALDANFNFLMDKTINTPQDEALTYLSLNSNLSDIQLLAATDAGDSYDKSCPTNGAIDLWGLTLNSTLEVKENQTSPSIKLYPNPTSNFITIENNNSEQLLSIDLLDYSGKHIKSFDPNNTSINLSDLNPGIYLLQISTPQGNYCEKIRLE